MKRRPKRPAQKSTTTSNAARRNAKANSTIKPGSMEAHPYANVPPMWSPPKDAP